MDLNQGSQAQDDDRDGNAKMALGFVIGISLGFGVGLALDSLPIGMAIGAGMGVSLAMAFSREGRQPSRTMAITSMILLIVGIIVLAAFMHLARPQWWCGYPVLNLIPGC
jgi:multidrug transporter EmrE-like cation transporter